MREDVARQVYPVLLHGLKLSDRLARGDRPHLPTEQATLKGLLGSAAAPAPWGSDRDVNVSDAFNPHRFLGIRYALACWLDELFVAKWGREWDENKLESALFQTNLRYTNFWAQARLAEALPGNPDAHESFFLCVLLGFRGEMADTPERLREWVAAARSRASRSTGREPPSPPEKAPESHVPPLVGAARYRRMTRALAVGILVAVPVVAFLVVSLIR
jgi:type VI secretion system protein ImpK